MLNWLQQILTPRRARCAQRGERVRLRRRFERLEDRAMLSATMGTVPTGYDGNGFALQNLSGPFMAEAGMFAAPPQLHAGPQAPPSFFERMSEPAFGGLHNQLAMPSGPGFEPNVAHFDPGFTSYGTGWSRDVVWVQFPPSPMQQPTVFIVTIVTSAPAFVEGYGHLPVAPSNQSPLHVSLSLAAAPILAPKWPATGQPPEYVAIESPKGANYPALNSLPLASAVYDIPTAARIVSRDVDSAALLPAGALEAAFQSYSSQLLLVTTTASRDRALLGTLDDEAAPRGDALDDFIRLEDFKVEDDSLFPVDAAERERAAVDAVLRGLQDLNTLPDEPNSSATSDDETNVADNMEFGFAPIADAEGGMVMLEASGDANDGDFNLASAADYHLDVLDVRVGVEASVGFYQAVDVATEDLPAGNILPAASPVAEPAQRGERNDRVSTKSETSSLPKAAAAVGATTFVGALLWASQRSRPDDGHRVKSADEKRRRRNIAS